MAKHSRYRLPAIAGALLLLGQPIQAAAAGYIKIPDIKGESKRADSSQTRQPYLTITLKKAVVTSTQSTGHSAGDEHEVEYDVASAASTSAGDPHDGWIDLLSISSPVTKPGASAGEHEDQIDIHGLSWGTAKRTRGTMSMQGERRVLRSSGGPGKMRAAISLEGCKVGKRYPHILVGEDGGATARLEQVRIASCAAEEVSFYYNKIIVD